MVLADSSIWIDHLARPDKAFRILLDESQIAIHAFVIGEIALGSLADRAGTLWFLNRIPRLQTATTAEVAALIEWSKLFGTGLGYVDVHLLAAVQLSAGASLWTRDKRLRAQAERLGLALHN